MFSFLDTMSNFEKLSICLTIFALVQPYIILLRHKLKPAKINFYPNGKATLFFNFSGSYIRIDGILESENKSAVIKKISVSLKRMYDNKSLNLEWSSLISPVNQQVLGNYTHTYETAHAFRIEANSVVCAFAEYGNPSETETIEISNNLAKLKKLLPLNNSTTDYEAELLKFVSNNQYNQSKNNLTNFFFWTVGDYLVDINVKYNNKNENKTFYYKFSISKDISDNLCSNIDKILISEFNKQYNQNTSLNPQKVKLERVD